MDGYLQLRPRTEALRHNLLRFLLQCRADGKRVVGYGAPGKGNTLLNYCGIRSDLLEYIVDRNPYKHGCFTPGMRIPIHDPKRIAKDRPDVVLALPWDLEAELTEQLSYIAEWGGQLVFPFRPCSMLRTSIGIRATSKCRNGPAATNFSPVHAWSVIRSGFDRMRRYDTVTAMTGASIPRDHRGKRECALRVLWLSPLMRPLARVQAEELRARGIDVLLVTTDQHPESDTARDYELVLDLRFRTASTWLGGSTPHPRTSA